MPNTITGMAASVGAGDTGGPYPGGSGPATVRGPGGMGGPGRSQTVQAPGSDPSVFLSNLKQWVLDQLQRLRNFRRPYDQRRSYFYRQYIGQRDRRLFPDNLTPRSNTFVPYPYSNTEAIVARVQDAFFSLDPALEVRPVGGNDYDAECMQNVMLTVLHRANWVKHIETFVRDLCIYGHAGLKVDWDWGYDVVNGPEPIYQMIPNMDPVTGQPIIGPDGQPEQLPFLDPNGQPVIIGQQMVSKKVPRNCPKFINIDIYDLLIDPDEKMKGHVVEKPWGELKREAESNPDLYFPEAIAELTRRLAQYKDLDRDGVIIRMAELWDDTNKTVTLVTFGEDADAIGWKDRRYQYRNASYSAYKRRVYNGPPVLLYTGPNQFAHKRIPVIDMPYTRIMGDVYGYGLIEAISDLSEGINVFTNMITDNWNMGINRRYAYDVMMDIDHEQLSQGNVPGGKVAVVGDPSRAIFPLPSFTPNEQDYTLIGLYKGMLEMTSGVSDFYAKGVGSPTGNRTATGISSVVNEAGYGFKKLIRNVELECLQPLMEIVSSLIQQYGTDEMEWSLTNTKPGIPKYGRVKLERLVGQYAYDFVAANYATQKQIKQRNLMAFYNLAMQSPYAQQGEFLKEIARALEIPYANRLLKPEAMVQADQQAAQQNAVTQQVLEHLMKFEKDALVKAIAKKEPNMATEQALERQHMIEQFLMEQAGIPLSPQAAAPITPQGRPRQSQFEGTIPGGGEMDMSRSFAQNQGANALGTAGISGE